MEERKQKEIEYYNRQISENSAKSGDFEGFDPRVLKSFQFCYEWLAKNSQDKTVLDFGCGNGIHSLVPARAGAQKVIGIDLSEKSLEIARKRINEAGMANKVEFRIMDCEKMDFPDNYFDVIFDGGTFSSLDLEKVYPELRRVLKPEGRLLGVETFGHNPFTNFKRKLNKITGKRTGWAEGHIFNEKYLKMAEIYFGDIKAKYFHLFSWAVFPFLKIPGGKFLLNFLEIVDQVALNIPFLRKYAFKITFIFGKPKK